MSYRVKNWSSFQSYKDRSPTWIRLHKSLLDNYDFVTLPLQERAALPMLWLLASESDDPTSGIIKGPDDRIAFRLRLGIEDFKAIVKTLIVKEFIEIIEDELRGCNDVVTEKNKSVTPEKRRDREETETDNTHSRARGAVELPDEFMPNLESVKVCIKLGVDLDTAISELFDWAKSKKPKYHDWQATFRNSVRRMAKNAKTGGLNGRKQSFVGEGNRLAAKFLSEPEGMEPRAESLDSQDLGDDFGATAPIRKIAG